MLTQFFPIDRRFRKATTSVVRPRNPLTKRHFIIPSSINPIQASRQLRRVQRRSRCRPASKHGIVVDNRWKGRVNLGENAGILVETRLRTTTRAHWMTFRTWMDRFVANSSRRRERSTMCADSRIHINPVPWARGTGGEAGVRAFVMGVPTPCHRLRLRHWDWRDREWAWIDRMWLLHSLILSEQPETRHFARYRASISPVGFFISVVVIIVAIAATARTMRPVRLIP